MGVGPLHTIDEVAEGNEVMEKRERQKGITTGQAKGRTQRWRPLQPNLARVNEAARRSGQTRFTALLHHVDVAALERGVVDHLQASVTSAHAAGPVQVDDGVTELPGVRVVAAVDGAAEPQAGADACLDHDHRRVGVVVGLRPCLASDRG